MITVEGLGGKGSLWCVFMPPLSQTPCKDLLIPAWDTINPIQPFECYMPPIGPKTVFQVPGMSAYGPRLSKVEIGTLIGVRNSPDTQNPCEHSTMTGALSLTSSDPLLAPHFRLPSVFTPGSYEFYSSNKKKVSYLQGAVATLSSMLAYDRYGVLQSLPCISDTEDYWYTKVTLTTDCCGPVSSPNPQFTNGLRNGMLLASIPDFSTIGAAWAIVRKHTSTHVSANRWIVVDYDEYHGPDASVPASPLSFLGFKKTITAIRRTRTFSMVGIQSINAVTFRGLFDVVEVTDYMGYDLVKHVPLSGTVTIKSSIIRLIFVLAPGLSLGATFPKDAADAYCASAIQRAKMLYKAGDAKIARSNCVSDVSALDSNWIENLSQIGGTAEVLTPLILGLKAVKTGDVNAARRALAGAYLAYKYVVAPGISDYKDVSKNIGTIYKGFTKYRYSNERRRGKYLSTSAVCNSLANLTYTCVMNLQLKEGSYATIFNALERLGLDPSAGNFWDLIPFSFVVDWFLHIGPALTRMDKLQNNEVLRDVKSRVESFKVQWPLGPEDFDVCSLGNYSYSEPLKYSWYDRRILSGLGSYDPFSGQSNDGLSVSQMTQGAALLSSYRR